MGFTALKLKHIIPLICGLFLLGYVLNTHFSRVSDNWLDPTDTENTSFKLVPLQSLETVSNEERWRPGRQKWHLENNIFSLSVLRIVKFVQREIKQRQSD